MAILDRDEASAIADLDAIDGSDPNHAHRVADAIILNLVSPAVREAYVRLIERAEWWAPL